MRWQALVPLKQGPDGKSRLRGVLSDEERRLLTGRMSAHVLNVLNSCDVFKQITVLSPECPSGWNGDWRLDEGRGLNAELAAWYSEQGKNPYLILHADLPLLCVADILALIALAEEQHLALATDRTGQGTNALALAHGGAFEFRFGPMSRQHHIAQFPNMPVLCREGLMADLDMPSDLEFAVSRGFRIA